MKTWNVPNKHLSSALLFFFVLTASNYDLLLSADLASQLSADPAAQSSNQPSNQVSSNKSVRAPTSVQSEVSHKINIAADDKDLDQTKKIDIGCGQRGSRKPQSVREQQRFSLKDSLLMLKGKSCLQKLGYNLLFIRNLTNGFTATVFEKNKSEFSTDFIQMNQGLNQVVFELENSKGEKFTEIIYFELKS